MKNQWIALLLAAFVALGLTSCNTQPALPSSASVGAETADLISIEEIQRIALTHGGVSEKDAVFETVTLDTDARPPTYKLDFTAGDRQYNYQIDPFTGTIQAASSSPRENPSSQGSSTPPPSSSASSASTTPITAEQAKKIALDHAAVPETTATFVKVELDYDHGQNVYEVEFYVGATEYDYTISMAGAILSYDYDVENFLPPSSGVNSITNGDIGETAAKNIALAKVPGATSSHIRINKDTENGHLVYEGEIIYEKIEYDFEIDATTGAIISWSVESIYD